MATNTEIQTSAEKIMSAIEQKIAEQLTSTGTSPIDSLKEQITVGDIINKSTGKKVTGVSVPKDAIDAFAAPVVEQIGLTSTDKYNKTKWAQEVIAQLANVVTPNKTIKTGKYTIKYESLSMTMAGIGRISAKVTWGNYETTVTWENLSKKNLQAYFDTLKQLDKDLFKEFATKFKDEMSALIKAIYVTKGNETLQTLLGNKIFKKTTTAKLKSEFKNYVKKFFPDNKELLKAISAYEALGKKYNDLVVALNTNKNIDGKATAFLKAANDLEISLGLSTSSLSAEYSFSLVYNENNTAVTVPNIYGNEVDSTDYKSAGVVEIDASKRTKAIKIFGTAMSNEIYGGFGNDTLYGLDGNDTLEGGFGNDTLTGGDGADVFYYSNGDGTDVITDYQSGVDKIYLASGTVDGYSVKDGKDAILTVGKGKITLKDVGYNQMTIVMPDNTTLGYSVDTTGLKFNKNDIYKATAVTVTPDYSAQSYTAYYPSLVTLDASERTSSTRLFGNAKNNVIYAGAGYDALFGDAGNDSLFGGNGNDKLFGEAGNDTLVGGSGNDILKGGDGVDVFYYYNGDGNDVITDYQSGVDKIYLAGGTIDKVTASGKDVTFKIGKDSIKVQNAKNKDIDIVFADGSEQTYRNDVLISNSDDLPVGVSYDRTRTVLIFTDAFVGTMNFSPQVKMVDISKCHYDFWIYGSQTLSTIIGGAGNDTFWGGAGNDSIRGGAGNDSIFGEADNDKLFGEAGNDTLSGGYGDDTLTGGKGADVFYYYNGDGNDVITDYQSGDDKIYLASGTVDSVTMKSNNVIFHVGNGSIDVQKGKGKNITVVLPNGTAQTYRNAVVVDTASFDDLAEDFGFTDAASPDVSDLDSLMNELPTENVSVDDFLTGTATDSFKLLDGVTFAQASNKK